MNRSIFLDRKNFWSPIYLTERMLYRSIPTSSVLNLATTKKEREQLLLYIVGEELPPVQLLIRLSAHFGLPIDFLLGRCSPKEAMELTKDCNRRQFATSLADARDYKISSSNLDWPYNLLCDMNYGVPVPKLPGIDHLPGILLALKKVHATNPERNTEMVIMRYRDGATYKKIADHFGITLERTRQIIRRTVVSASRYPDTFRAALLGLPSEEKDADAIDVVSDVAVNFTSDDGLASVNVYKLGLSVRPGNCLARAGIKSLAELKAVVFCEDGYSRLSRIRNLGDKSALEIFQKVYDFTGQDWSGRLRPNGTTDPILF